MATITANGTKTMLYRIIGILSGIIIIIMSYVFVSAISRNDKDHDKIIKMLEDRNTRIESKVDRLSESFHVFMRNSPIRHTHPEPGTGKVLRMP